MYRQVHSVNAANLDNLKWYVITARKPAKPKPKRNMYSGDVPGGHSDVPDEYSNNIQEEYSGSISDQYSDAMLFSIDTNSA